MKVQDLVEIEEEIKRLSHAITQVNEGRKALWSAYRDPSAMRRYDNLLQLLDNMTLPDGRSLVHAELGRAQDTLLKEIVRISHARMFSAEKELREKVKALKTTLAEYIDE